MTNLPPKPPPSQPDAFRDRLEAAITGAARASAKKYAKKHGRSLSDAAAEAAAAELAARGRRFYDDAAGKITIPPASPAQVGAANARRMQAVELAETEPAEPPRGGLRQRTRAAARVLVELDEKEKNERVRLERIERARSEQRQRFEDSYRGKAPLFSPKQWVGEDYAVTAHLRKIGGRNARERTAALFHVGAQRLRRAALGQEPIRNELGKIIGWTEPTRTWADSTAQDIAAVGLTLFRLAAPTKRVGWNRVASGISEGMLATLLVNRLTGQPMDRRTIERHVRALRKACFFYSEQPPAAVADPTTVGPSGHAINLYYFSDRVCEVLVPRRRRSESAPDGLPRLEPPPESSSGLPPPS